MPADSHGRVGLWNDFLLFYFFQWNLNTLLHAICITEIDRLPCHLDLFWKCWFMTLEAWQSGLRLDDVTESCYFGSRVSVAFIAWFCLYKRLCLKMISCAGHTERAVWLKLLGVGLIVLTGLTVRCEGGKLPGQNTDRLCYRLTDVAEILRRHVDSIIGAHTTTKCLTVSKFYSWNG